MTSLRLAGQGQSQGERSGNYFFKHPTFPKVSLRGKESGTIIVEPSPDSDSVLAIAL